VHGEGTRIGTVRRPPRGVPKSEFAAQNWYDVWFPNLAPSVETMKLGQQAESAAHWSAFARKYRAEMATPEARNDLELLAVLSHTTDFSVGCYCENEDRCHRSLLRQLLIEHGAAVALHDDNPRPEPRAPDAEWPDCLSGSMSISAPEERLRGETGTSTPNPTRSDRS
jgi:uncharacterized protein YeaO (DUF488 family)